jgi:hypothetical protein
LDLKGNKISGNLHERAGSANLMKELAMGALHIPPFQKYATIFGSLLAVALLAAFPSFLSYLLYNRGVELTGARLHLCDSMCSRI